MRFWRMSHGSIKIPETAGQKKQLEQDPMIGMAATGKTVEAETGTETQNETKAEDKTVMNEKK